MGPGPSKSLAGQRRTQAPPPGASGLLPAALNAAGPPERHSPGHQVNRDLFLWFNYHVGAAAAAGCASGACAAPHAPPAPPAPAQSPGARAPQTPRRPARAAARLPRVDAMNVEGLEQLGGCTVPHPLWSSHSHPLEALAVRSLSPASTCSQALSTASKGAGSSAWDGKPIECWGTAPGQVPRQQHGRAPTLLGALGLSSMLFGLAVGATGCEWRMLAPDSLRGQHGISRSQEAQGRGYEGPGSPRDGRGKGALAPAATRSHIKRRGHGPPAMQPPRSVHLPTLPH